MNVPQDMKVIDVLRPGGPDELVCVRRPVPSYGPGEVLIRIAAAGVNRPDILQRRGRYPPPSGAPTHPGLEVAGTVVQVGADVRDFAVGDRVCALLQGGGYAEYCAVASTQVLDVPGNLTMIEAASLPETYFTVWANVFGLGRLRDARTLLVHGGSSGIGVAAIQLASALGHTVFATAGSEEKCRFCRQLGAAHAVNYKQEDFVAAILAATNARGVDVILDMVGGSYLARNLQSLATEGRLVIIATQDGTKGEADLLRIMQQRLTITGSTLRARSASFKATIRDEVRQTVWPLISSGRIKPVVDRVFPLIEAAAAHAYMESGGHMGKIVLRVD